MSATFLSTLTDSLVKCAQHDPPKTSDFTTAIEYVVPVFDQLGTVLAFAKTDMVAKNESIKQAASSFDTLKDLVEADKQADRVTVKNSLARNLHRLRTVVLFIQLFMHELVQDRQMTLQAAVSEAYGTSLSQYHSMVVRGTCNAGFLMLPTRDAFLQSIGETEQTAIPSTEAFIPAAKAVIASIDKLYDGPMPASTAWF